MFRCRVSHQMIAAAGWALGCASIMPLSATAQVDIESLTPVKNVAVADRPRPEYAAPGVSVGAFNISPTAGVEHAYDSNVLARDTDAIGSGVYYVFYLVWFFGCFNLAQLLYPEIADQGSLRQLCMLGIHTELTHTFTLNYDDVVIP